MAATSPQNQPSGGAAAVMGGGRKAAASVPWVLECRSLTKQFGGFTAVDRLTFNLKAGEVLGFLGPNGAGKSTTVGMILGLIKPTNGTISIAGQELERHPEIVADNIGAIIENPAFYPYLTGRQNLQALAIAAGGVDRPRIESLLKLVNMAERADGKYKTFSLGMKQRLGIAATLLTDPAIVILDEPTNGLDPAGQREIREIIPRLAAEGHAVLLASHMLHEVEQVSDRIAIVRKGQLIKEGSVDELLETGSFVEAMVAPDEAERATRTLQAMPWVERVEHSDGVLRIFAPDDSGQAINRALVEQGIYASMIAPRRSSLEEFFLDLTESEEAPATGAATAGQPAALTGDAA